MSTPREREVQAEGLAYAVVKLTRQQMHDAIYRDGIMILSHEQVKGMHFMDPEHLRFMNLWDDASALQRQLEQGKEVCECIHTCADDPATACSLSGDFHTHPGEPCPVHPDAPCTP